MRIIEQKPNLKISATTSGVLNDWTYDQIDIIYNQNEFTYDGIVFYDIITPHSIVKSLVPKLRIK